MAYIINSKVIPQKKIVPPRTTKRPYEIPERYRNAFYLANAAFFDSTNWFLHRAYEVIFPTIKDQYKELKAINNSDDEITDRVEQIVQILDQCNSIIDIRFPIKRDNGKFEVIRGFRAHYGFAAGHKAALGGLRIHENITRDHMKALSVLSAYRNSCMSINMVGAHGGIKIDPRNYSQNELQSIVENYTLELMKKGYCCENDIFQPDINSSSREMQWISKAVKKFTGSSNTFAVTGISDGECLFKNYNMMPPFGAFVGLNLYLQNDELMKKIDLEKGLKGKTFIIQGIGKVGILLAELLENSGAICVGVKDIDAYIYEPKGIDLKELYNHKSANGSIKNYKFAKEGKDDSIYTKQCDILILAAYQKSLICYLANEVKAKVVLEAADGPVTPSAHRILTAKRKLVIPDVYAGSGSAISSYLEYLWNLRQKRDINENGPYVNILDKISLGRVNVSLISNNSSVTHATEDETILRDSVEVVLRNIGGEMARLVDLYELGTDLRTSAYILGITNMFKSICEQNKCI